MDVCQEKVRIAAACIAGTEPAPDWLISVVGHAVRPIHGNHETRQLVPARSVQREKLKAIRAAATLLAEQFTAWTVEKQAVLSILEDGGLDPPSACSLRHYPRCRPQPTPLLIETRGGAEIRHLPTPTP